MIWSVSLIGAGVVVTSQAGIGFFNAPVNARGLASMGRRDVLVFQQAVSFHPGQHPLTKGRITAA